ncbi:MAG: DNA-3-methyladenine glycosylase family protein [Acidimicrobiia bacterium]|jgi:3-methyladenine DNA glycosylase/8-oxoguanine DNA glycosylase
MSRRTIPLPFAIDLRRSLGPLRLGKHDPTFDLRVGSVAMSMLTPAGPASLRAVQEGGRFEVEAWGEGADWALDSAPGVLGCLDDRAGFDPEHPLLRRLHRSADGFRLPRTGRVHEALVRAVLSQRVTGFEAKRAFRLLVERWGEPAPGPVGLLLVPSPQDLGEVGYYDLHVIGVEKKRADALKRVCAHAGRLEQVTRSAPEELRSRLEAIAGVGEWTSAEVARAVLGDADAVSVGDFHLKHLVAWALASEPRGTDDRMLELLEPYRPHRGRVCALLESAGVTAPRYGPRQRIEPIGER